MKNTGVLLKSKRESSSLSLSEVALATKINPKILAAIENGDEAHLPAKTFLKGFVRSYALFLKMDVDAVMRSFQEETGGPAPAAPEAAKTTKPVKGESSTPKSRRVDEESSSGLRTIAVVVIVVLIGLIIGVRELIEKYQRERVVAASADLNKATPVATPVNPVAESPKAESAAPSTTAEPPPTATPSTNDIAPNTGDEVTIESTTVPPVPETVRPSETKVAVSESASGEKKPGEPKAPEMKAVETKIAAQKPPAPAPQILSPRVNLVQVPTSNMVELRQTELSPPRPVETKSVETPKPEVKAEEKNAAEAKSVVSKPAELNKVKPETPPAHVQAAKNEIILEALDKVEVKFQVKGETKRVSLGPSQVHTIHAELPMTLDLSDGGAVNIILNGRERGVPGDLGKPKTIRIP